jgi:hypothetical protein
MRCEIESSQPSGRMIVAVTALSFLLGAAFQAELETFVNKAATCVSTKLVEPVIHFDMPRIEDSPGEWICDFGFRPLLLTFSFHRCVLNP